MLLQTGLIYFVYSAFLDASIGHRIICVDEFRSTSAKEKHLYFHSGLQYLKEKPLEAVVSGGHPCKLTLPQKTAEELGGADPDVQLCYCIEATFMDIISCTLHGL